MNPGKDGYITNPRYVRWQANAMAQVTVAIALLSGLSVSALGGGLSLLQVKEFASPAVFRLAFLLSMFSFMAVVVLCLFTVVSRTLDFRLTARKVRGKADLTIFRLGSKQYGRISWGLFWLALAAFLFGVLLFAASVGTFAVQKLICGA